MTRLRGSGRRGRCGRLYERRRAGGSGRWSLTGACRRYAATRGARGRYRWSGAVRSLGRSRPGNSTSRPMGQHWRREGGDSGRTHGWSGGWDRRRTRVRCRSGARRGGQGRRFGGQMGRRRAVAQREYQSRGGHEGRRDEYRVSAHRQALSLDSMRFQGAHRSRAPHATSIPKRVSASGVASPAPCVAPG